MTDRTDWTGASIPATTLHIAQVRKLMISFAVDLIERSAIHDASKFDPVEQGPLDELERIKAEQGEVTYGTPEYKERTKLLGPMIEHHYANNSHHPEFHREGIYGIDLLDLVEMVLDWVAAGKARNPDGVVRMQYALTNYDVSPMLTAVIQNTYDRMGVKYV